MTAALLSEYMPYGAPELQRAARPHMVRALALSCLLGAMAFALAWSLSLVLGHSAAGSRPHDPVVTIFDLPPPPTLRVEEPVPAPVRPATNAATAIPVPVPEAQAPTDQTVMNQQDLQGLGTPATTGAQPLEIAPPADEVSNTPGTLAIVDEYPEPVKQVQPIYPALALDARVQGLVKVNLLVGKDGRVLDVQLDPKVNVPILNQAALEAARQWVFKPALVNNHPVAVWVGLPFRFTLR